jgi:hypothetical protein
MLRVIFSLLEGNFYSLKSAEYHVESTVAKVESISIKTKQVEVLNIMWAFDAL